MPPRVFRKKKPQNPDILEFDYNLLLSIKVRELVHHTEEKHLFNQYQFGSRLGRCYLDPIIIEEFQNEINQFTRKSFIKTNLDTKACYDKMIASLTTLVSQKYGMEKLSV